MAGEKTHHQGVGRTLLFAGADDDQLRLIKQQFSQQGFAKLRGIINRPAQLLLWGQNQAVVVALVVDGDVLFSVVLNQKALVTRIKVKFHGIYVFVLWLCFGAV